MSYCTLSIEENRLYVVNRREFHHHFTEQTRPSWLNAESIHSYFNVQNAGRRVLHANSDRIDELITCSFLLINIFEKCRLKINECKRWNSHLLIKVHKTRLSSLCNHYWIFTVLKSKKMQCTAATGKGPASLALVGQLARLLIPRGRCLEFLFRLMLWIGRRIRCIVDRFRFFVEGFWFLPKSQYRHCRIHFLDIICPATFSSPKSQTLYL